MKLLPALACGLLGAALTATLAQADNYVLDTQGAHAFIGFRIKHLGYSWLYGRFNRFDGHFNYDENAPSKSNVVVTIDTTSIDSNHAERDKHLRSAKFLDVDHYPEARFTSTSFEETGQGRALLRGNLNLHGYTRPITIEVEHIGHGPDPWGGHRRGFLGTTRLVLKDFGIDTDLGYQSRELELTLSVEGIRQ